jgi:DGQHR domain-containing protein
MVVAEKRNTPRLSHHGSSVQKRPRRSRTMSVAMSLPEVLQMTESVPSWASGLPFNPMEGQPIPALKVDDFESIAVMPVRQLLQLVPDPVLSEDAKMRENDPMWAEVGKVREEVQRLFEGAKKKNAFAYGQYLADGVSGKRQYWVRPPITLYHEGSLKMVTFPGGATALLLPFGHFFVAIDGETQRYAWQVAARGYPPVLDRVVPVVIHHGKPIAEARQAFHDLNTLEVKPNAAVAIAMDTQDPATRITREVIEASDVLRDRIQLRRRQLRQSDPEILTISALRTGVVTTMFGVSGLQFGSRPVGLPDGVVESELEQAVVEVWTGILEQLEDEFDPKQRSQTVVSAPSILAAIGVVAHHSMPSPPRDASVESWSVEEVLRHLEGVTWQRGLDTNPLTGTKEVDPETGEARQWFPWDGIAGKVTPRGRFSIGGPKEVGYTVAAALEDIDSEPGRRVRSK